MIILGIDPGTRRTGFGILEAVGSRTKVVAAGMIRLMGDDPLEKRLVRLHADLQSLFNEFKPAATVVEKIFFGKNADSAFKLGHARGVCLLAAAANGSNIEEYAARWVKKAVTGSGAASKQHVQMVVTRLLEYRPETTDFDVSDALALALCHARSLEVGRDTARALGGQQ